MLSVLFYLFQQYIIIAEFIPLWRGLTRNDGAVPSALITNH